MTVPEVSPTLIHPSITIIGSWVTSLEHMRELVEPAARTGTSTPRSSSPTPSRIADAAAAYQLADAGRSGKIALVP